MANLNSNLDSIVIPGPLMADPIGIGLRHSYYEGIVETKPPLGFIEVHPENYFGGGINRRHLEKAREIYALSFHAVGLSFGSADGINMDHLSKIKELINIFEPFQFSDHASWSASGNAHLNDLLPMPYTQESLDTLCDNVSKTQDYLGRQILVENPSTYIAFADNEMEEYELMNAIADKTGCKLLLDINNIHVQCHNHGNDPHEYIVAIKKEHVGEIHLAGYTEFPVENDEVILIDTHSKPVYDPVWKLYERTLAHLGSVPTLIEWDDDLPPLDVLLAEADKARQIMHRQCGEDRCAAE